MDLYLHFFISLGITTLALLVLMIFFPSIQKNAPRFWDAERRMRSWFSTLTAALGFIGVVTIGIAKEWYDSYGFGDVEASDLFADVAGVIVGLLLILKLTSNEKRRRIRVTFSTQTRPRELRPVNLFRRPGLPDEPPPFGDETGNREAASGDPGGDGGS